MSINDKPCSLFWNGNGIIQTVDYSTSIYPYCKSAELHE